LSIVLLRMRILPQRCASWNKSLPDYRVHLANNRPFRKNRLGVVHLQGLLSHEVTLACVMHPYDNSHRNTTHHLPPCVYVQLFYTELGRFQVYLSNNFLCLRRLILTSNYQEEDIFLTFIDINFYSFSDGSSR